MLNPEPVPDPNPQINLSLKNILLVDEITRRSTGDFKSHSLPGHLLHIVYSGKVSQQAEGRPEIITPKSVVWYHNSEPIHGKIIQAPWRFITINFHAPNLSPPPDNRRVIPTTKNILTIAETLLNLWQNKNIPTLQRELLCSRALIDILLELTQTQTTHLNITPTYPANATDQWWLTEKTIRQNLDQPLPLETIARIMGTSTRTTIRACKAATGLPPGERIRQIRTTHATSLLQHTNLPITEIAAQVGYERVQEFSRDFKKRTNQTPTQTRQNGPDHQQRK